MRYSLALLAALTLSFALLYLTAATARAQIIKDTEPPKIVEAPIIDSPEDGDAYRAGETISVTLTFSETVQVTGKPRLRLMIGNKGRWAKYDSSASSGASLTFNYVVKSGDKDDDGVSVKKNSLRLKGGSIKDGSDNKAKLKHEALSGLANHKVNGSSINVEPQQSQDTSPSAPTGVGAQPIGDKEVRVFWNEQKTGQCPATHYSLRLYNISDHPETEVVALAVEGTEYTVTELKPNTNYEVELRASGCGKWSSRTHHRFTTTGIDAAGDPVKPDGEPKMPPNPPKNINIEKSGSTATVTWDTGDDNTGRCPHSYYAMFFGKYDAFAAESDSNALVVYEVTSPYTVTGRKSGQEYVVYVSSYSKMCGSFSTILRTTYTHP